jgi:hypothetical protein
MVMVKYNGNIFDFSSRAELSYGVTMKHELSCKMKHTGTMDKFRSLTLFAYNRALISYCFFPSYTALICDSNFLSAPL